MLTHYDLFAGIGGFSLAVDQVFDDEPIRHIFCEWDPFPTAVLKWHWPRGLYYGDIADLVADLVADAAGRGQHQGGGKDERRYRQLRRAMRGRGPSLLTGGFPCQPFSFAGRRHGTADDRYKWPEMFAVIRSIRPTWVIAENVPGLATWNDGVVLEHVCADLESQGYDVQPLIIPACAVNAPHRRDRIWFLACQAPTNTPRIRVQVRRSEAVQPQRQGPATADGNHGGQRFDERQWE